MAPKFHHLSSSHTLLLIIFYISCFITICQSHSPVITPLDFLKELNGTHKGDQAKGLNKLKEYLTNLGYIHSTIPINKYDDLFDDTLELAIKKFQEFYSLKITGFLDQETLTLMLQPRCGVSDFPTTTSSHNGKTLNTGLYYAVSGYSWPPDKRNLTFSLPVNTRKDAYTPITAALNRWANVTRFNFTYTPDFNHADVKISFQRRDHGDGYPFDGPNGILGHAFYPTDGRVHFDAEENWKPHAEPWAIDLATVALHEVGHVLGLAHSKDPKSVMFAFNFAGESKDLTQDDIDGIRSIYPSG